MRILAIDPGNVQSAFLHYRPANRRAPIGQFGILKNEELLAFLEERNADIRSSTLAIETFRPRGQPLYWQLIETAIWIGQFKHAWGQDCAYVTRSDVKYHILGTPKGKDGNIRAALVDRFGGKEVAIGRKKSPGVLYGISKDVWAALAVAVTYADRHDQGSAEDRQPTMGVRSGTTTPGGN